MRETERANPASKGIDALSVGRILEVMHSGDREVFEAVGRALPQIEKVIESAATAIGAGGRVFYAGAGTSGRLGVMDAAEVRPTFSSDDFIAFIAGGGAALTQAVEGAEDDEAKGAQAAGSLTGKDVAIGISASGRTPYVIAFLEKAKQRGASAWLVSSNAVRYPFLDGAVTLLTGPEIVAGSTRLKAATAQKLCLNMISTVTMIKLGKVYDGLMVDVQPANKKLVERAVRIISACTGAGNKTSMEYLEKSGMNPKTAVVMIKKNASREEAARLLRENGGRLRGLI
ncbi:MAG: N-acetylmuramic acid 6-phosphate etherase [Nitrospiraceae bacterium]|nr:N-acetylmuramic acid 6-phosphate etherase [Nitrospiraceae bacterium]